MRDQFRRRFLAVVLTAAAALATAGVAQAAITPVTKDAAGASLLATAMAADTANLATPTAATFQTVPPFNNPNGVADAALNEFPTNGTTFAILTSGCVELADDANTSGSSGCNDGGATPAGRGDSAFDVTVLAVNLVVPTTANCLSIDFKFFSDEFPEFVGSDFNDAFIAELDTSNWTTSGSTISAPNNFAFDPSGNVISINAAGATSMTAGEATGTTYDGATPLLKASTPVTSGNHVLYLSIFDQGDHVWDSAVFLDNLQLGFVSDPTEECEQGAQLTENCTNGVDDDGDGLVDGDDPDCAAADTTKPNCDITATGTNASGQKFIEITVQDPDSGLADVIHTKLVNAIIDIPAFSVGTTDPLVVTATKVNQSKSSTIELQVTDVAGNITICDPVVDLVVGAAGKPANKSYSGLPAAEHFVTITNGDPGVQRIDVNVNGQTWKLTGIRDNEVRTLDVTSAMVAGDNNTISVTAYGRPGGSALLVIADS